MEQCDLCSNFHSAIKYVIRKGYASWRKEPDKQMYMCVRPLCSGPGNGAQTMPVPGFTEQVHVIPAEWGQYLRVTMENNPSWNIRSSVSRHHIVQGYQARSGCWYFVWAESEVLPTCTVHLTAWPYMSSWRRPKQLQHVSHHCGKLWPCTS